MWKRLRIAPKKHNWIYTCGPRARSKFQTEVTNFCMYGENSSSYLCAYSPECKIVLITSICLRSDLKGHRQLKFCVNQINFSFESSYRCYHKFAIWVLPEFRVPRLRRCAAACCRTRWGWESGPSKRQCCPRRIRASPGSSGSKRYDWSELGSQRWP